MMVSNVKYLKCNGCKIEYYSKCMYRNTKDDSNWCKGCALKQIIKNEDTDQIKIESGLKTLFGG
jgi:hypothetical protein